MWTVLKWLAARLTVLRWISKILSFSLFVPVALLLKAVGLPALMILGVLALPVLLLFVLFGLPVFLVLVLGGLAMGVLFAALSAGLIALKVVVFVVVPIWIVWQVGAWLFGSRRKRGPDSATPDSAS